MSQHLQPSPSDRRFDAGSPPPEWLKASRDVRHIARILSLWETTVALIHDEQLLGTEGARYMSMIEDHKREFNSLCRVEHLPHVEQTLYLHLMLENARQPTPSFAHDGFRIVEDPSSHQRQEDLGDTQDPVIKDVAQDEEVKRSIEEIRRLWRVISELDLAEGILEGKMVQSICDTHTG